MFSPEWSTHAARTGAVRRWRIGETSTYHSLRRCRLSIRAEAAVFLYRAPAQVHPDAFWPIFFLVVVADLVVLPHGDRYGLPPPRVLGGRWLRGRFSITQRRKDSVALDKLSFPGVDRLCLLVATPTLAYNCFWRRGRGFSRRTDIRHLLRCGSFWPNWSVRFRHLVGMIEPWTKYIRPVPHPIFGFSAGYLVSQVASTLSPSIHLPVESVSSSTDRSRS